jgi:low affinity Fe/Cu permease
VSFARVASLASQWSGTAWAFLGAVAVVLAWLASGPLFRFSDTWQLVINTGTTVVTFLMVFLIQNTQNRDAAAAQLKLDELIRASDRAHSRLIAIEKRGTE